MLKKLYDKNKLLFSLAWIVAYCVLMSVGDGLSASVGIEKSVTFVFSVVLSVTLFLFLKKNGLLKEYGLCKSIISPKRMLYYLPILLMLTVNLWDGVALNYGIVETILFIGTMLCVGFLEEVIFRGLLFKAMKKDSVTAAIIVSSVTFGMGHVVNLINGSGATLLSNLLQVVYATAAGFMFVMMYCKSDSLLICIAAHGAFNALSVFENSTAVTVRSSIWSAVVLTVITGGYALCLALSMKKSPKD